MKHNFEDISGMIILSLIFIGIVVLSVLGIMRPAECAPTSPDEIGWCSQNEREFLSQFHDYVLYDCSELSPRMIMNRSPDTLLIERVIGEVVDAETGDGAVLNAWNYDYNYIGYRGIDFPIENGMIIVSYFTYETDNNYLDGIADRWDFVLFNPNK